MPDFKKSFPKHKPFKCLHYWHLRASGLFIATYDLIGAVTNGGENAFTASIHSVSKYFQTDYESQRRVFAKLRRDGWLELEKNGRSFRYVKHDDWAKKHPGKCNERELALWQVETDPLVGQIWAASGGKVRVFEAKVIALRRVADSDEEIMALFRRALESAEQKRAQGIYGKTSPYSSLNQVLKYLKDRAQRRAAQQQKPEPELVQT